MGARGPLPEPNNIRPIRGRVSHSKPKPDVSPQFVSAIPNPPTNLSREALAEWKRITPELGRTQVTSMGDRALLATYCRTWASICQLEAAKKAMVKAIAQLTDPMEILEGWEKVAKIEGAINAKVRLMLPMQQQLLLTPVSRLRTPPPKGDEGERPTGLD